MINESEYLEKYKAAQAGAPFHAGINYGVVKSKKTQAKKQVSESSVKIRDDLLEVVRMYGPMTSTAAGKICGIDSGKAASHLMYMEQGGLVSSDGFAKNKKGNKAKIYFVDVSKKLPPKQLLSGVKLDVIKVIGNAGPVSVGQISELCGCSKSAAKWACNALVVDGLIELTEKPEGNTSRDRTFYRMVK